VKEILFHSIYATHLLEMALQKNASGIRSARESALSKVDVILAGGGPEPTKSAPEHGDDALLSRITGGRS
jgi:hypothetical protein